MARYRLRDNHPTMQKLDKVLAFMEENQISIEVGSFSTLLVDHETGETYELWDLEDDHEDPTNMLRELPPKLEFKATYNK